MKKESCKKIAVVTIFAIAMAFLEAVVVIYLRKIYYPDGFDFPLVGFIEPSILNIEWVREAFTIVMLACIGWLAGKKFSEKFAYFLYSFAIWDIFYYVWLKTALDWPSSLTTWDMLFLIPFPWAGPVLAPIINSITMILLAFIIIHLQDKGKNPKIILREWVLLFLGGLTILYTYLYDYGTLIINSGFLKDFFELAAKQDFKQAVSNYIPSNYNWILFWIGEAIILIAIWMIYVRTDKNRLN